MYSVHVHVDVESDVDRSGLGYDVHTCTLSVFNERSKQGQTRQSNTAHPRQSIHVHICTTVSNPFQFLGGGGVWGQGLVVTIIIL